MLRLNCKQQRWGSHPVEPGYAIVCMSKLAIRKRRWNRYSMAHSWLAELIDSRRFSATGQA